MNVHFREQIKPDFLKITFGFNTFFKVLEGVKWYF